MVNGSRAKIRRGQAVKAIFRRSKILTPVAALDTAPMGVTPPWEVEVGLRVARGPDWQWGDQDGGEGCLGTITGMGGQGNAEEALPLVLWDYGYRSNNYRCGKEGKHDLVVYDTAPTGMLHPGISCGSCHQCNIHGIRWKCTECPDFNLCTPCYYSGKHSLDHQFSRIDHKDDNIDNSMTVPARKLSRKITARGFFPSAKVIRGQDWVWGDQDGGKHGFVTRLLDYDSETDRSVVEVEWTASQNKNIYRAGHKGKVDLKCLTPGECDGFYPEHLPKLDAALKVRPQPTSSVGQTSSASNVVSASPLQAVAQNTPTVAPVPVAPILTPPPSLSAPVTSTSPAETPTTTAPAVPTSAAVATLSPATAATAIATPSPASPTATAGTEPSAAASVVSPFAIGSHVRVQLELEIFRVMQEGHGGWMDDMAETLVEAGMVQSVLESGDIRVKYPSGNVWTLNPDTVVKVEQYKIGDAVRILDDIARVHDLQENHGGWIDDMALSLGQVGRVSQVFPTGDVRVGVNGMNWTFNPACLALAPGENPPEVPDLAASGALGGDLEQLHLKLLSLLDNPAVAVAAAAQGDASTVKEYLSKHPQDVNSKAGGKTALHCAVSAGHIPAAKAILEFHPDLEVEDEDGDTPLHVCAWTDEDEAAQLLIDHGANLNSINKKGATPLIIAAIQGHYSVLRILASHPKTKLHQQDDSGDTALHCAVLAQKNESVTILLEAGADPTLLNFRLCTPIHEAAKIGFLPALEHFIRKQPDCINLKKDDGYTALHLASLNNHLDVVTALVDTEVCNMNEVTETGQTALHIAVHQGHARTVERLVGFGIDLNMQDSDGDTALHIALARDTTDTLSAETPQLKKVQESFGMTLSNDSAPLATATVACFLIQEGADSSLHNHQGLLPTEVCSPVVAAMVMTFSDELQTKTLTKFHGSLRAPAVPPEIAVGNVPQPLETKNGAITQAVGAAAAAATVAAATASIEECFLCDAPVDVKFEPCGHAILCSECAERAKKCLKCKAAVKRIKKIMCSMCNEEKATVTMRPCGHEFCQACAERMKRCFDCRQDITAKEGLETQSVGSPGGTSGPNCGICLINRKDTALLCGHQLCWDCAQKIDHCPVCRKFVTHRIQLFQ